MTDTEQERELQTRFEQLRAELAVPTCSGDCASCPLTKQSAPSSVDKGALSDVSFLTCAEVGPVT